MKYVQVPSPIDLYSLHGERLKDESGAEQSMSFRQFVLGRLIDPAFGCDMAAISSLVEIKTQLQGANGVLSLENADWERLVTATRLGKYHPLVAHNLLPFMRAITDAASEKPREH